MAVDFFLVEAPRVVPVEFAAWEVARLHWRDCFYRALNCVDCGTSECAALNDLAVAASTRADLLEQSARDAFRAAK